MKSGLMNATGFGMRLKHSSNFQVLLITSKVEPQQAKQLIKPISQKSSLRSEISGKIVTQKISFNRHDQYWTVNVGGQALIGLATYCLQQGRFM